MNTNNTTATLVEDIRDIRPPIHIPYGWLWAAYLTGALALAGLAYSAWRRHKRGSYRRKPLYEVVLEQLEAARKLMTPEQAYTFSITVSEIVRDYIEHQFEARAAHRTTEEFLHDLMTEKYPALVAYRPALGDFLEHCDLAKFAHWQLSVPEMKAMHLSACEFVFQTGRAVQPVTAELQPTS